MRASELRTAAAVRRAVRCALAVLAIAIGVGEAAAQRTSRVPVVALRAGLVIEHSVRVKAGRYRLSASESLDSALIIVRGNDLTVDFGGAVLEGIDPRTDPDQARGVAILVEGGRNVRIVNARIHGYKVAIMARGTRGLALVGNDVSYNWKPRLFSLVEHESLTDWLSFHHNESDEWLRFGAAMYLSDVRGGEIRGNIAEQGMNGLLVVRSDSLRVQDNDFSFNSGLGVGLYRSSRNTIVDNRMDYDVRGYSHGFYKRGQDSAGLLMYEQSIGNVVAFNSATHGGDGLFLWAGQSTMDTGQGGANDNVFFANDFSFAPANSMEATFSRNLFIGNRAEGSDYGLWGGYSYNSTVVGNCFLRNRVVIAIEHGQENVITGNLFAGESTAVKLWADSIQPSDWGYPKHRDTRNRDNRVEKNTVVDLRAAGDRTPTDLCLNVGPLADEYRRLVPGIAGVTPKIPGSPLAHRDRSAMVVDEWGPYDWRSPKLWPLDSTHASPPKLVVLGPPGTWRVSTRRGIGALSSTSGRVGDTITVTPLPASTGDWQLVLEYRGAATVSSRGERHGSGVRYQFTYDRFEPVREWMVRFFTWDDATDPRKNPDAFMKSLSQAPLLTRREPRLDYEWYRPAIAGLPQARFAVEATAAVVLAPGDYTLRTISDDAVRVWVDGTLTIDNWTPHESTVDFARLAAGRHELRVLHYQVDGWTELRLDIVRGVQHFRGSPGPH